MSETTTSLIDTLLKQQDRDHTAMSNMAYIIGAQRGVIAQLHEMAVESLKKKSGFYSDAYVTESIEYVEKKMQELEYAWENRYDRAFTENMEEYSKTAR